MNNMYWEYAGTRYRQKYLAMQAAGMDQESIKFNVFGKSFHSFNWSVEPSQSFKELCKLRALQLRDEYKFIRLWFSGGSDSTTMLNVFLENNIHIDEIVTYRFSPDNNFDCFSNVEINHFVIPYLKNLNLSNTKIKLMNFGKEYFDDLFSGDNYFYKKNKNDTREFYIPKIRGKNFCNLFGDSDPCLKLIDGKWYETIWDTTSYMEYRYRNMEMFFTSESMLELHSKQCHVLKNYCTLNGLDDSSDLKSIQQKILRDKPVVTDVKQFEKKYIQNKKVSDKTLYSKDYIMLLNSDPHYKSRFADIMKTTIGGAPLHLAYRGFMSSKHYLGDK